MKNKKEQQTIYYTDELNQEFSPMKIAGRKIDENYNYGNNGILWNIIHFIIYRIIALPIAAVFLKLKYHHKIVNKEVLKQVPRKQGIFTFANHTNPVADALIPTFVNFPRQVFVIVHPNNVSIPVLGNITHFLGALPLPDTMGATKNFMNIMKNRINEHKTIHIYPEAHIWPFYTKIRPFIDASFKFPISMNAPVFCFTNTYQRRGKSDKADIVTYVDGPFYPNKDLSSKEQRKELRDRVYETMCKRAQNSNIELIKYVKVEKENSND